MTGRHTGRQLKAGALCAALLLGAAAAPAAAGAFRTVDLAAWFNADIFTTLDNRTDGQMDSGRSSFPAEMMPPSLTVFRTAGVEFLFPSRENGSLNAIQCTGQVVNIEPAAAADYLYILATAADGNQRASVSCVHEDGTTNAAPMDVNDWCAENPGLGGVHGIVSDYRHTLGGKQECKTSLWMVPVRLRSAAPVTRVLLPRNPNIFVVALSFGPAGEERRVQTYIKDAFLPSAEQGIDRLVLLEIVEPGTNSRLRVLADDNWSGQPRELASFALQPGVQAVPVWLPVLKRRTYAFEAGGEIKASLDETNLFESAPKVLVRAEPGQPVHPADAGFGMAPAWHLAALTSSAWKARIHLSDAPARELAVQASIVRRGGEPACRAVETVLPAETERPASLETALEFGSLEPGTYDLRVAVGAAGLELGQAGYTVTVLGEDAVASAFGAREADLGYLGPVWTNWDAAVSYEAVWEGFTNRDVVVDFPGSPCRLVFWKGASYCPLWMFDKSFISLEWMEAWPRQEGAVDCIEPLQDKACVHSRVELLGSTPARARVRWTYKETDFNLKVIEDEHAEEIYTIYPDAIGVRRVTGHFRKGRWHEVNEFINGSAAGTIPSEHFPPQAASLLNADDGRLDLHWPKPQEAGLPVWNEYIGLAHSKRNPAIFLACTGRGTGLHIYSNNPDWLPEVFFCMPHWPIQRGLTTTNARTIEDCRTRATHASLLNIYAGPHELWNDRTVWALLVGIAPAGEAELRELVRGWLHPPALEMLSEPPPDADYDPYQRGYVLEFEGRTDCSFRVAASPEQPQIRPAFILEGAGKPEACSVSLDGAALAEGPDFTWGAEDGRRVVVWLNRSLRSPSELNLSLKGGPQP